jgi:drug/metabolite transporter (DMT)-like permease
VSEHSTLKGVACVLFSVLIWSGWMVVSRYSMKGSLTAYDIAAIRFGVAGLLLLPVAIKRGLAVGPYGLKGGLLLALLIGAPYTNIAVAGMKYAPASHASTIINCTLLVMTTGIGVLVLREKTTPVRLAGVACSLAGIVCMLAAKDSGANPQQWLGHLLFVASGAMWAIYTLLTRAWKADSTTAAASVCVLSMVGFLPIYFLFIQSHIGPDNWREVAFQGFYQGLLTGVVAFISFNNGIRILGASHAGSFIPLVPVISTVLAIPFLHEVPTSLEWGGVAAVSLGVFLSSGAVGARRRKEPEICEASEAGAVVEGN